MKQYTNKMNDKTTTNIFLAEADHMNRRANPIKGTELITVFSLKPISRYSWELFLKMPNSLILFLINNRKIMKYNTSAAITYPMLSGIKLIKSIGIARINNKTKLLKSSINMYFSVLFILNHLFFPI